MDELPEVVELGIQDNNYIERAEHVMRAIESRDAP